MIITVRNTTRIQKSVMCEDGNSYYLPPRAVKDLASPPLGELPEGVVYVTAPIKVKSTKAKTK